MSLTALIPLLLLALAVGLIITHFASKNARKWVWKVLAVQALLMFLAQPYLALSWAPREVMMGDPYRIIYMHVPHMWMAFIVLPLNCFVSVYYLVVKKSWVADALAEALAEVGVYLGGVGWILGSIWARPTWGVFWSPDPRLITAGVMVVLYLAYLTLRRFIEDPEKRATWSAVVSILAAVDLPLVWFAVKWRSIHQLQSSPSTVDPQIVMPLRWSAVAFLCFMFVLVYKRYQLAMAARAIEIAPPEALNKPGEPPANNLKVEAAS